MKFNAKTFLAVLIGSVLLAGVSSPADAGMSLGVTYATNPADIQVWLERADGYRGAAIGYDVYRSANDVILNVRASRSCYAAVYVVDNGGYIHVVYPLSPQDNTYLRGGNTYRFYMGDFVAGGVFDRGVAYAFAVSSPFHFTFDRYGLGVFNANLGFQVHGDPYLAARRFYVSILPPACGLNVVGVSHTRFYIGEYVRYPRYLCAGWHDAQGTRTYCRANCEVYKHYRANAADPFRALRPTGSVFAAAENETEIIRTDRWQGDVRIKTQRTANVGKPTPYIAGDSGSRTWTTERHTDPVVKSSKDTFVRSKKDISAKRQQLKKRNDGQSGTVAKKSTLTASKRVAAGKGKGSNAADTNVRVAEKKTQVASNRTKTSSKPESSQKASKSKKSKGTKSTKDRDGSR